MGICKFCGKEIYGKNHHGKEKVYCNIECVKAGRKQYGFVICFECGEEFKETRGRPNKFCSRRCSAIYTAREKATQKAEKEKTNPITNEEIRKAIERLNTLTNRAKKERQCTYCGKWFVSIAGSETCSDECRRKRENYIKSKRIKKNGKPDNTITLPRLFEKYNGICNICGKQISFECSRESGDYPSIDHIKPISKGGLHRWNNVQLACRSCNIKKRDKWEE